MEMTHIAGGWSAYHFDALRTTKIDVTLLNVQILGNKYTKDPTVRCLFKRITL